MRMIDAEPQLVTDILEEMELTDSKKKNNYTVYIGHHKALGRMIVIEGAGGNSMVIEID